MGAKQEEMVMIPKAEYVRLTDRLAKAESLLGEASGLLDDIHGYDTDTYRAIDEYFEEGE